jgi:hypothetical protein
MASLWWLERNYPDEFALRTVSRNITSHELVLDKVSPEQLTEDIRLARVVAEERPQLGKALARAPMALNVAINPFERPTP